jgi:hypothetical protein
VNPPRDARVVGPTPPPLLPAWGESTLRFACTRQPRTGFTQALSGIRIPERASLPKWNAAGPPRGVVRRMRFKRRFAALAAQKRAPGTPFAAALRCCRLFSHAHQILKVDSPWRGFPSSSQCPRPRHQDPAKTRAPAASKPRAVTPNDSIPCEGNRSRRGRQYGAVRRRTSRPASPPSCTPQTDAAPARHPSRSASAR